MHPESKELSNSSAKVFIYIGQSLVKTYYVPQNLRENLWTVFKLTADGQIEDINGFSAISIDDPETLRFDTSTNLIANNYMDKNEALRLNGLGTKAYKEKDYPAAIQYYLQAIGYYPDFGQAYGNLGSTYQKANMYAESLWASRKAITLASGNTASTTRSEWIDIVRKQISR